MRLMRNITHELQPGEMHCNMRNIKDQLTCLSSLQIRLTDRKLHPEIFSQGVLHAGIGIISPCLVMTRRKVWELTWAELPALLLDQMIQFRRAVT